MKPYIKEIKSRIEDGRLNTSTKIETVEAIISDLTNDDGELSFDDFLAINDFFNDYMYGGVKERMTVSEAIRVIESRKDKR